MISPREVLSRPSGLDLGGSLSGGLRWLRRQRGIEAGEVRYVDDEEIRRHWVEFMEERTRQGYDNVILWTGDEGSGKTSGATYFARQVDPEFDRLWRAHEFDARMKLSPRETLEAVAEAERGDAILFDEAAMGILSQDRFDDAAKALVRAVNVSRKIGNYLFLAIPDVWDVTRTFRARRAELLFYCQYHPRGVAWVHTRRHRLTYETPGKALNLWKDRVWNPVTWDNPEGSEDWAAYKRWSVERARDILRQQVDGLERSDVDPRGKMATCPVCGLSGSRWNIQIHKCPGKPAETARSPKSATAAAAAPNRSRNPKSTQRRE